MDLEQLLSTLRGPILGDRSDRIAGTSDYLWTDAQLVLFINEAQRRFAAQSLVLRDGTTPECTEVILVEGQDTYTLHERVFAVLSAKREGDRSDLTRVGHSILSQYRSPTQTWLDPDRYNYLPDGKVLVYSTDEYLADDDSCAFEQVILRVYPTPDAAEAGTKLKLRVVRLPLQDFELADLNQQCEIPLLHQINMLDWAAYLALRIEDDDAGNKSSAKRYAESFQTHVKEAKRHVLKKLFAPKGWGFGRGGFTWEK